MYKNIGGKIKGLAKTFGIIGIAASVLMGIGPILAVGGNEMNIILVGVGIAVVGSLVSWISTWLLYGFGELIAKTAAIEENIHRK